MRSPLDAIKAAHDEPASAAGAKAGLSRRERRRRGRLGTRCNRNAANWMVSDRRPALDRTQPGLPLKKGRCGTMTHDYKRNGTTTLFAALELAQGKVIGQCVTPGIVIRSFSNS